jgi:hypothetical protein
MNVLDPNHPEHAEFLEVMQHPVLKDPIVLTPTLQHFIKAGT